MLGERTSTLHRCQCAAFELSELEGGASVVGVWEGAAASLRGEGRREEAGGRGATRARTRDDVDGEALGMRRGVAGHGCLDRCQSLWEWYAWLLVGKAGTTTPVGRRDRVAIASDCGVGEGGHVVL